MKNTLSVAWQDWVFAAIGASAGSDEPICASDAVAQSAIESNVEAWSCIVCPGVEVTAGSSVVGRGSLERAQQMSREVRQVARALLV